MIEENNKNIDVKQKRRRKLLLPLAFTTLLGTVGYTGNIYGVRDNVSGRYQESKIHSILNDSSISNKLSDLFVNEEKTIDRIALDSKLAVPAINTLYNSLSDDEKNDVFLQMYSMNDNEFNKKFVLDTVNNYSIDEKLEIGKSIGYDLFEHGKNVASDKLNNLGDEMNNLYLLFQGIMMDRF